VAHRANPAVKGAWVREFAARVRALPGVAALALPKRTDAGLGGMQRRSRIPPRPRDASLTEVTYGSSPPLLRDARIGLPRAGFTSRETADPHARVAVISEFIAAIWQTPMRSAAPSPSRRR